MTPDEVNTLGLKLQEGAQKLVDEKATDRHDAFEIAGRYINDNNWDYAVCERIGAMPQYEVTVTRYNGPVNRS